MIGMSYHSVYRPLCPLKNTSTGIGLEKCKKNDSPSRRPRFDMIGLIRERGILSIPGSSPTALCFIQFSYSFLMKVTQENWLMRKSKRNGVDVFVWMCTSWDSFPKKSFRFSSTFLSLLALTDGPESPAGKVMLVFGRNLREITVLGSCCYKMMVVFLFFWKMETNMSSSENDLMGLIPLLKSDPIPKKPIPAGQAGIPSSSCS